MRRLLDWLSPDRGTAWVMLFIATILVACVLAIFVLLMIELAATA